MSNQAGLMNRPFYYTNVDADPKNADLVYVNNEGFYRSMDGGATWERRNTPHGDNHDMWINPDDDDVIILGNDGGALVTLNGGKSWSSIYNQPTAEMYHVTVDNQFPYRVYGAQQDNTTMSVPSRSRNVAIIFPDWKEIGGGESGYIAVHPDDPD
ncbi:MAG TPA: glycosyl hydrolase, partial [Bacteroidia bacterium]|nr:glycosyl hydrolase [Bacteroidia bacterium]